MSILTGPAIHDCVVAGLINISPYDEKQLNPNSYNLKLGKKLVIYRIDKCSDLALDMRNENPTEELEIPETGLVLYPNILYLGETEEYTDSPHHVPHIEGRSSVGRLGMQVHVTAGFGDVGFRGKWTLEITVVHPLRVYAGVEVCQVAFQTTFGKVEPYKGKYLDQKGVVPSFLFKDFK
jgi:dCTP deaminase